MITVIKWAAWILMWVIAVAFAWSDVLCMMTLFHYRKERTSLIVVAAILAFALIAAAAVYAAITIGRCL